MEIDSLIKEQILEKAISFGLPKDNSIFFDQLQDEKKKDFENNVDFKIIGTPVILFFEDDNSTLIGTKGVFCSTIDTFNYLIYSEIEKISSNDKGIEKKLRGDTVRFKFYLTELVVLDNSGKKNIIKVTPGSEFFCLWHVLLKCYKIYHAIK